jgi:hypothetical protein
MGKRTPLGKLGFCDIRNTSNEKDDSEVQAFVRTWIRNSNEGTRNADESLDEASAAEVLFMVTEAQFS